MEFVASCEGVCVCVCACVSVYVCVCVCIHTCMSLKLAGYEHNNTPVTAKISVAYIMSYKNTNARRHNHKCEQSLSLDLAATACLSI